MDSIFGTASTVSAESVLQLRYSNIFQNSCPDEIGSDFGDGART